MTDPHPNTSMLAQPQSLVGIWRGFGSLGRVYDIVRLGKELPEHAHMMRTRGVDSGAGVDYRFSDILDNPLERWCSGLRSISWCQNRATPSHGWVASLRRVPAP